MSRHHRRCSVFLRLPPVKYLVFLLLVHLHHARSALNPFVAENGAKDAAWVFSSASIGRMVPLLRRAEAATRLRNLVTEGSNNERRKATILLRPTPVPVLHQAALLQAAQTAFAAEERLLPGVFESHARTLLLVLHAAFCGGTDPREVLRVALANAGLVTGVLDVGGLSEVSYFSSCGQPKFAADSWEAVASAEEFVSDVQRLAVTAQRCVTTARREGEETQNHIAR